MRAYVLCAKESKDLAHGILSDYKEIQIIPSLNTTENLRVIEHRMTRADLILVIVDKRFAKNEYLKNELKVAIKVASDNKNCFLVPVIIEGTEVPEVLKNRIYISSKWDTAREYNALKRTVGNQLAHRYNISRIKEDRNRINYMIIVMTIVIECFSVLWVLLISRESNLSIILKRDEDVVQVVLLVNIVIALGALVFTYYLIYKKRFRDDNRLEIEAYSKRLKDAIVLEDVREGRETEESQIDALGRMMINLEDIKEFYTWSQKQAKASFMLAIAMCVMGFGLLIAAIILPLVLSLEFQVSILTAIGGVTTELLAGTALVVYRNSLLQLNHYHKALHEDERFLSSVNLVSKLSNVEVQDEMIKEIIRNEIQMNLLGVGDKDEKKGGGVTK